jgi:hypothetical protein
MGVRLKLDHNPKLDRNPGPPEPASVREGGPVPEPRATPSEAACNRLREAPEPGTAGTEGGLNRAAKARCADRSRAGFASRRSNMAMKSYGASA